MFGASSDDPAEGDGYLFATVFRAASNRSDLIILDAADVGAPPIAVARLEHRIPHGFHGIWQSAA